MGLKVGLVKLEEYTSEWKILFEKEKENLEKIFGNIAIKIEHVGSTSIEGLAAKPIIDIMVCIEKFSDFEKIREYFDKEPYSIKNDSPEDEILVRKGPEENRTHFIHIVENNSIRALNTIIFRDYLRNNKDALNEYEKLKKDLAEKYSNDRKSYTTSKSEFIQNIINKAKEEYK